MASENYENYLKSIYTIEADKGTVSTSLLSDRLKISAASATEMIKKLAEAGLITHKPYRGVRLTEAGKKKALQIVRRHRLWELFLVEVLKYDWEEIHDEAERLEHAVSEQLIDRIDEMLGRPEVDPHGDPIPNAEGTISHKKYLDLLTAPLDTELVIARVIDQDSEFLRFIEQRDLMPGSAIVIESRDPLADAVRVRSDAERSTTIGTRAASKVLVRLAD